MESSGKIVIDKCVIKGYHAFKIRPPYVTPMPLLPVDREYSNTKDENACLVWLPPLSSFSSDIHDLVTDEKRQLKLSDVAGLPIGHVPKCLSKFFCTILDDGGEITAEPTGPPVPSFPPWPAPSEEGGGIVIPCKFNLTHMKDFNSCFEDLKKCLLKCPEGRDLKLYCQ